MQEFDNAAKADGGVRSTEYIDKSSLESFAEAFAYFVLDPGQLRTLRPAIFGAFSKRFS
jgi:hypothetical protein